MPLTGHLSDLSLSELIEFFCNQRKTGQLKVLYPQGPGYFYLQTGSVVDARVGVLRGIDAVYYALTLPNAKFEFGGTSEPPERTINQPWTQVVLEGLRRLDEGIVPASAFPPDYHEESEGEEENFADAQLPELESQRVPSFLSFMNSDSVDKRKYAIAGGVAFAVIASVAAIGVPAGWYGRAKASVPAQPPAETVVAQPAPVIETPAAEVSPEASQTNQPSEDAAQAAKRQREKEKEKAKAREEKATQAGLTQPAATSTSPANTSASDAAKSGPKKVTVTVAYDESGRVTQASGADPSAVRIARQKRFPAGKAGSATITIPIN